VLDLAQKGKTLLSVDYADADQAVLVWDQLNTHTPPPLCKALLPPAEARRLLDRLEIHYTPEHGIWFEHRLKLNQACPLP